MNKIDYIIEKAKDTHEEGHYDYSQSEYRGIDNKIKIYCNKHEEFFWQRASHHVSGQNCPKCAHLIHQKKVSHNSMQEIAEKKRADYSNFDYSDFEYTNLKTPSTIHCLVHEQDFVCSANNHFRGQGCIECSNDSRKDKFNNSMARKVESISESTGYTLTDDQWKGFDGEDKKSVPMQVVCNNCGKQFKSLFYRFINNKCKCPYCAGGRQGGLHG